MKNFANHIELEQKLSEALGISFPAFDINCQVEVVHTDKWWACYVFARQDRVSEEQFRQVIRRVKLFFRTAVMSICRPRNQATGIDPQKRKFFYIWLPVPPARTYGDFAKFDPVQTV